MWIVSLIWLNINDGYKNSNKPLVGNLLIVIGTLIYNEIIILNCYDLHKFTKTEIILRGEKEILSLLAENMVKFNKEKFQEDYPLSEVMDI